MIRLNEDNIQPTKRRQVKFPGPSLTRFVEK